MKKKQFRNKVREFRKMTDMELDALCQDKATQWLQMQLDLLGEEGRRRELMGDRSWSVERGMMELLLGNQLALRLMLLEIATHLGVVRKLTEGERRQMKEGLKEDEADK